MNGPSVIVAERGRRASWTIADGVPLSSRNAGGRKEARSPDWGRRLPRSTITIRALAPSGLAMRRGAHTLRGGRVAEHATAIVPFRFAAIGVVRAFAQASSGRRELVGLQAYRADRAITPGERSPRFRLGWRHAEAPAIAARPRLVASGCAGCARLARGSARVVSRTRSAGVRADPRLAVGVGAAHRRIDRGVDHGSDDRPGIGRARVHRRRVDRSVGRLLGSEAPARDEDEGDYPEARQ